MSEQSISDQEKTEALDTAVDSKVIIIVFATMVLFAVHLISGFTFDF